MARPRGRERTESREGLKVFLDGEERDAFERVRAELGMSQREAATRLVAWFLRQDDVLQRSVLGLLPPSMEKDVARLHLERVARGKAATHRSPLDVRKASVPE